MLTCVGPGVPALERCCAVLVQVQFLGGRSDRFVAAASPNVVRKPLRVDHGLSSFLCIEWYL